MSRVIKTTLSVVVMLLVSYQGIFAAARNSSNYSIQSDSINFSGGFSTSASFEQESTLGEVATGPSSSSSFNIKAGYQQMQTVYLAITTAANVTLSPSINGTIAGTANGSTSVTATTDNVAGYELYIKASSSPALISGSNSFADYTPSGANPDFTFSVGATASEFGFTPEGADVVQKYLDDGVSCNTGAGDTADSCWSGLSTTNDLIVQKLTANQPSGTPTTLKFRAENGSSNLQSAGNYTATATVTLLAR